jgi:hypothetical protein
MKRRETDAKTAFSRAALIDAHLSDQSADRIACLLPSPQHSPSQTLIGDVYKSLVRWHLDRLSAKTEAGSIRSKFEQKCSGYKGKTPPRDGLSRGGSGEPGRDRWEGTRVTH